MKELVTDADALLRRMVATPSESFEEEAVCALLETQMAAWGLACTRVGRNLVARNAHYNASLPTLALDAHLDTVPPAASYTRNPYEAGEDPEVIYGLGSNDDGGSVVAMLAAFRYYYHRRMPINLVLTLTCEEERSGPDGAAKLYGPEFDADWVIIGEPTGMRAATSERGLLVIDAEAKGVSGHAARDEGVNALYIALEDITRLRSFRFPKVSPVMGAVRLNVTQIDAGSAHNVIPDNCRFVVDIRPTEQYTNEEILQTLQTLCTSRLQARNLRNRSSATYPNSPLSITLAKLGIETFSSPTTSNWMRVGRDAIKMGPGDSARSHRADEYILHAELEQGVRQYIDFIRTFYGNTLE